MAAIEKAHKAHKRVTVGKWRSQIRRFDLAVSSELDSSEPATKARASISSYDSSFCDVDTFDALNVMSPS